MSDRVDNEERLAALLERRAAKAEKDPHPAKNCGCSEAILVQNCQCRCHREHRA